MSAVSPAGASALSPDAPLSIAYLTYRGKPHVGGQGVYTRHLTKALVDLETYLRLAPDALDSDEIWEQVRAIRGARSMLI